MSTSMETEAGNEVALGAPQATHIDVHIHQEPALGLSFLLRPSVPNTPTPSQTPDSRRLLVVSRVAQVLLGLLSGALGGFGCILLYGYWDLQMICGAGIWTGAVAVLACVTVFIYEKRGGTCWALLKTLFALAAFGTAIAAIYIGANYFHGGMGYWFLVWCGIPQPWESPRHPSTPEEARRQRLCLSYQDTFQTLSNGLKAMLLSVWVLLLLTSLVPLLLFCCRKLPPKAEKDQKVLLGASEM